MTLPAHVDRHRHADGHPGGSLVRRVGDDDQAAGRPFSAADPHGCGAAGLLLAARRHGDARRPQASRAHWWEDARVLHVHHGNRDRHRPGDRQRGGAGIVDRHRNAAAASRQLRRRRRRCRGSSTRASERHRYLVEHRAHQSGGGHGRGLDVADYLLRAALRRGPDADSEKDSSRAGLGVFRRHQRGDDPDRPHGDEAGADWSAGADGGGDWAVRTGHPGRACCLCRMRGGWPVAPHDDRLRRCRQAVRRHVADALLFVASGRRS